MALPIDILWLYCNNVTEMSFVCLGPVVDFNFYSLLNHGSSLDSTYAVIKQVGSAGIQIEVCHSSSSYIELATGRIANDKGCGIYLGIDDNDEGLSIASLDYMEK
jgi:hypothetical protein